jgi:hypothetical protein
MEIRSLLWIERLTSVLLVVPLGVFAGYNGVASSALLSRVGLELGVLSRVGLGVISANDTLETVSKVSSDLLEPEWAVK